MRKPTVKVDEVTTHDIIRAAPGYYFSDKTMKGFGTRCADTAYVGKGALFLALDNRKAEHMSNRYKVCKVTVTSVEPLVITKCNSVPQLVTYYDMRQTRAAARQMALNSFTLSEEAPRDQD